MENANDMLTGFVCSDNYYNYHFGLVITEGVKCFADKFAAYWLLDIVASYYPQLRSEDFQAWKLTVNEDGTAIVSCTDGNEKQLANQIIPFTDFSAKHATLWVEGNVILLPSEH